VVRAGPGQPLQGLRRQGVPIDHRIITVFGFDELNSLAQPN
jgi:hypothetical protein